MQYLLVKRGLYYRPDSAGYTGLKSEAGRYPAQRADPLAGVTAIYEDKAPFFSPGCDWATKLELMAKVLRQQVIDLGGEPLC